MQEFDCSDWLKETYGIRMDLIAEVSTVEDLFELQWIFNRALTAAIIDLAALEDQEIVDDTISQIEKHLREE